MTPKELGLPSDDPHIDKAVAIFDRNAGRFGEAPDLRPRVVHLLQKRRYEDMSLMCLALLGGLPEKMDSILEHDHVDAPIVTLVKRARKVMDKNYEELAEEPDTVKIFALALATESLEGSEKRVSDISAYRRLADEIALGNPDPGLGKMFMRNLERRRTVNRERLGLRPFEKLLLNDENGLVRKAYDLLCEYAGDGRVRTEGSINTPWAGLKNAISTAQTLSLMDMPPLQIAGALIDIGLAGSRSYTDIPVIKDRLGEDMAKMLRHPRGSLRFVTTARDFKETPEEFRPVIVANYTDYAIVRMNEVMTLLEQSLLKADAPGAKKNLQEIRDIETRGRKIILPHADLIQPDILRLLFDDTMRQLTRFNLSMEMGHAPKILPPAPKR